MPFAPVNRMPTTQAPTENPCVSPQYGTSVTAAKKVNENTRVGAQLIGACGSTEVLCDMLYLKWDKGGRNVARPLQGCGTCVGFGLWRTKVAPTSGRKSSAVFHFWRHPSVITSAAIRRFLKNGTER